MSTDPYPLLGQIDSPQDLRRLKPKDLESLAGELRAFLLQSVAASGGHLASNLGTVELTIALHYVFNTPQDHLVWDVGHQSYAHKILTGRRDQLGEIRQRGGPAGFPNRQESEYDSFGTGHSSTSISAALGMALASALRGESHKSIAVIGDGAMTAGMAFEAMNHAGDIDADLLVVLNDNDMSISPNVGAMNKYLTRMLSGKLYSSVREGGKRFLQVMPPMQELARRAEEHVKGMITPGTLFEEMGFHYFGPLDGHDLPALIKTLQNLAQHKGPRLLHVVTQKGKGYAPAENDPCAYHGVSRFDPANGMTAKTPSSAPSKPTYTQVFGQWLCDMAEQDERLVGITPAMREGSGLVAFSERFPSRYFDVGIAEQHALTLAAGMACQGLKPVVAIYSTFLQRAYDQLIHDIALQNLPVVFAVDRAGLVGPDGPTHAGSFDLSYLRCIPNMTIMAPADENECRRLLCTAFALNGPAAVRYPRGQGPGTPVDTRLEPLPVGKGEILRRGQRIALLAFGAPLSAALQAAQALDASVANMRFVKPLDQALIRDLANTHEVLVTLEDNAIAGGAGSAVNEFIAEAGLAVHTLNLGLADGYLGHDSREALLAASGLDAHSLINTLKARYPQDCEPSRSQVIS